MQVKVKPINYAKVQAEKNIAIKIGVLENWASELPLKYGDKDQVFFDENGNMTLDFIPKTLRQFCFWDGSQNCTKIKHNLPKFHSNNNTTLSKNTTARARVELLLKSLAEKVATHKSNTPKSRLEQQRSESIELKINLKNVIFENQLLTKKLYLIEAKYAGLLRSAENSEKEFSRRFSETQLETNRLKKEISELLKTLSKIQPLRTHNRE